VVAGVGLSEREIQERLQAFAASEFGASRGAPVGLDDGLLGDGIIDSMGVMQLVSFVEETLGVAIDDEEIVPENFASLRALAKLVAAKQGGSGTEPS
jgi:acyl carrier protein